jgi:pimeloyl-ACP methyl ester carboxylesterase
MKTGTLILASVVLGIVSLALTGTVLLAQPDQPEASPYDDEFNGPNLNTTKWAWYPEDTQQWSLTTTPGQLQIIGLGGDMWWTCNNPQNLLLQPAPAGNFEAQIKLSLQPATNFQQGGLTIFTDLHNFIKLDIAWNAGAGGKIVEFSWEENGTPPLFGWPQLGINLSNPAYLKITRLGNLYTGYYSTDGVQWQTVGSVSPAMLNNPKMGIFAFNSGPVTSGCYGSGQSIPVDFDYFRVTNYSISGRVTDVNNNPLPGVMLAASANVTATTNANGVYTLTGLMAGSHTIMPVLASYTFTPTLRTVTVPPNQLNQDFVAIQNPVKLPVLLVHGWQGLSTTQHVCGIGFGRIGDPGVQNMFGSFSQWLLNLGYDVWQAQLTTGPISTPSIEDNGQCLKSQVEIVKEQTGHKLILIGHSMGGLVSRACLSDSACRDEVSTLITLGSPHAGINAGVLLKVLAMWKASTVKDVLCELQPALCQFTTDSMLLFDIRHPNQPTIDYTFIGGTRMNRFITGGLLYPWDGLNDGMVGSYSAVGWLYPFGWDVVRDPEAGRYWTNETHSPRVGGPTYFEPQAGPESQAFRCIAWLLGKRPRVDCPAATRPTLNAPQTEPDLSSTTASVTGHLDSGQSALHTLPIDANAHSIFFLSWLTGTVSFTLTQPNGQAITPEYALLHPEIVAYTTGQGEGELPPFATYSFTSTLPGSYTLTVSALNAGGGGVDYSVFAALETSRSFSITSDADLYQVGQTAIFTGFLSGSGGGIAGAMMQGYLIRADGVTQTLAFTEAGGGLYQAAYLVPDAPGYLHAIFTATGNDGGASFNRQIDQLLAIAPHAAQLAGVYADRREDRNGDGFHDTLAVEARVTAAQVGTYTLSADLVVANQTVAHALEYAVLAAGSQTVTLRFNGEDIRRSRLDGPYTVTQLYLVDLEAGGIPAETAIAVWVTAPYGWRDFGFDNVFLPVVTRSP